MDSGLKLDIFIISLLFWLFVQNPSIQGANSPPNGNFCLCNDSSCRVTFSFSFFSVASQVTNTTLFNDTNSTNSTNYTASTFDWAAEQARLDAIALSDYIRSLTLVNESGAPISVQAELMIFFAATHGAQWNRWDGSSLTADFCSMSCLNFEVRTCC